MAVAAFGKRLAATLGLEVRRAGRPNRFDAMAYTLDAMRARGYRPRLVIDGGANVGAWTQMAERIFPDAEFHLVEPQTGCHAALAGRHPSRPLHRVVLTRPGVASVRLASMRHDGLGTGAFAARPDETFAAGIHVAEYPAASLDALFGSIVDADQRALLKLDLEGHELDALEGAETLLTRVEAVLCEVSFYDVHATGRVLFDRLLAHLAARGFALYDFAALSGRPRDNRLRQADAIFVRTGSPLLEDVSWA